VAARPDASGPVSGDEHDAVAELLARALDRCGVGATAGIMREVMRRHGVTNTSRSRIGGARFAPPGAPAVRAPDAMAREAAYGSCLAAHGAYRTRHPASEIGLLDFLRPSLDDRAEPDPSLCEEATGLLIEALDRTIAAPSAQPPAVTAERAELLIKFRDATVRRVEHVLAGVRDLAGRSPAQSDAEAATVDSNGESINDLDPAPPDSYTWSPDSDPGQGYFIEPNSDLERLIRDYLGAAGETTRDPEACVELVMTVVHAWREGRPIHLVVSGAGGESSVIDIPAAGATAPGHDGAHRATVAVTRAEGRPSEVDLGPPVPALTDIQLDAVRQRAEARPWSKRGDDPRTPFEWVRDHYGEWIPGLLQSHLKADPDLYGVFARRVARGGLPPWLDVPTEPDARIRNILDPEERRRALAIRDWHRERSRRWRSRTMDNS